jgi:hippurate hydrolase
MTGALADWHHWFRAHRDEILGWRHDLHAHPELAFHEDRTSNFVAEKLSSFGLSVERGIAKTGVVATLAGGTNAALGLRADMDALPLEEANTFGHRSCNAGTMHACGHDGHTTMLLAAAKFLSECHGTDNPLPNPVHFIFQPAEENEGGGRAMVEDGLFRRFPVHSVYGMHNMPGIAVGRFMVRGGPVAAGFDTFDIAITATGGHGSQPASGGDAIVASAALIQQLQSIVSRQIDANDSLVLAVTQIHGGTTYNVLPAAVSIAGSVRWFSPAAREQLRTRMQAQISGVARSFGVEITLDYRERYPAVINEAGAAALAARAAGDISGRESVATEFPPFMGSEDFAFMLGVQKGAYIVTGNGEGSGALHSPSYDFNDDVIESGAGFWVALCRRFTGETANGDAG